MRILSRRSVVLLAALTAAWFGTVPAQAGTTSGSVAASVTLADDCVLNVNNFSFGTSSTLQPTNVDATTTLQVQCSTGTPYTIAISPSALSGLPTGTTYNHALKSTTANVSGRPLYLPYNLTQDAAGATNWGATVGTDTVSGVGTGGAQTVTVYGHLTAQSGAYMGGRAQVLQPDTYTDTVTVALLY